MSAMRASANLFTVPGVPPVIGRTFSAEEEHERANVVVVSHSIWQNRFNGSPDAVGRTLEVNGVPLEIVGVMPDGFGVLESGTQFWVPQTLFVAPRGSPSSSIRCSLAYRPST